MTRIHWLDISSSGRFGIMARPRAGDWLEDEIARWRAAGLHSVISLLERDEIAELGLERESELCRAEGLLFVSFSIRDRSVPHSIQNVVDICGSITEDLARGRSVAVHCRAGIGRSALVAACALIRMGVDADEALTLVRRARGVEVPDTDEQLDWIMSFGRSGLV